MIFLLRAITALHVQKCQIKTKTYKWGQFGPKFQVQGAVPTNHSSCRKTRCRDLLWNVLGQEREAATRLG